MIRLPWPADSGRESTPPPRTDLDAGHAHGSGQPPEVLVLPDDQQGGVGRHRAPEVEPLPSNHIEDSLDVIKATYLRISLAWADRNIEELRKIASDEAEEPRFREAAERNMALLLLQEQARAAGWAAIAQTKRHPALARERMFLRIIQKTAE